MPMQNIQQIKIREQKRLQSGPSLGERQEMSEAEEILEHLIDTLQTAEVWVRVMEEVMEEEGLDMASTLDSRVQAARTEAERLLAQARTVGQRLD